MSYIIILAIFFRCQMFNCLKCAVLNLWNVKFKGLGNSRVAKTLGFLFYNFITLLISDVYRTHIILCHVRGRAVRMGCAVKRVEEFRFDTRTLNFSYCSTQPLVAYFCYAELWCKGLTSQTPRICGKNWSKTNIIPIKYCVLSNALPERKTKLAFQITFLTSILSSKNP